MPTDYCEDARQRFMELGGFQPGPEDLLVRREPGLVTLVAILPLRTEDELKTARDHLAGLVRKETESHQAEGLGLLLIVLNRPLTREEYDRWQGLVFQQGPVQVVPWVVDLHRRRLFPHQGPPFGINPDLVLLAAPEPPAQRQPAEAQRRGAQARRRRPPATIGLLVAIVAVWVLMTITGRSLTATEQVDWLYTWGAMTRADMILSGEYWRLLTAAFLHIGLVHLLTNAISLWFIGEAVESLFGSWRMLYIFLVSAVGGSILSVIMGPPLGLSAGASGGLFGLLGALIWYRIASPSGRRIAWGPLLSTLALNLLIGLIWYESIDNWGHLGGLLSGILAAMAVGVPWARNLPRPGLRLPRPLQAGVAAAVLAAVGAVLMGFVPLPGASQDLAQAVTALNDGQYASAEPLLDRVISREPDEAYFRYLRIVAYVGTNQCEAAAADLQAIENLESAEYAESLGADALVRACGNR